MIKKGNPEKAFIILLCLILSPLLFEASSSLVFAATDDNGFDSSWTIYYRPGVRFGSDDRTLYINDFLIPIYQDDKSILFNNTKFTPNDQDGWEVNVGLGTEVIADVPVGSFRPISPCLEGRTIDCAVKGKGDN